VPCGPGEALRACVADRGRWLVGSSAKAGEKTRGWRAAERAGLRDAELGERLLRERVLGRAGLGWILGLGFGPEERAGRAGLLAGFWAGFWVFPFLFPSS
jgi:hypothetical protein